MRRLMVVATAALSLAAGSLLVAGRAEALPLPGAGGLAAAGESGLVQDVRYVCRPVWNGWRWVEECYWVRPRPHWHRHHHHRRHFHRHHRRHR